MGSKSWIYTIANYEQSDIDQLSALECTRHRCAKETGIGGLDHLQGFIVFYKNYRLSALKKLNSRAHWEETKSKEHAVNYCTKGTIIIDTNNKVQGKRNDLAEAIECLKTGGIESVMDEHPGVYLKYNKIENLLNKKPPNYREVTVHVLYGPPGSGKTRRAYETHPNLYRWTPSTGGKVWFDGYTNQDSILLDDYNGQIQYEFLLQMLDKYPMRLEKKGSFCWGMYTYVWITSNIHPSEWHLGKNEALLRRIDKIEFVTDSVTKVVKGNTML